jgi:AAA ATPase domain/AAA domain
MGQHHNPRRDFLMIKTARVKNFRGFEDASLAGLRRINILVGDSGSGKTALLEALFLACGANPEIPVRLRQWRSMESGRALTTEIFDGLYLSILRNLDRKLTLSLAITGSPHTTQTLTMAYHERTPVVVSVPPSRLQEGDTGAMESTSSSTSTSTSSLTPRAVSLSSLSVAAPTFRLYQGNEKKFTETIPRLMAAGIQYDPLVALPHEPHFLGAQTPFATSQTAKYFADFDKFGKAARFTETIKEHFKTLEIEELSVGYELALPVIMASIAGQSVKLPVNYISSGLTKLLTILFSIARSEQTAVFVDEIENGFHFSRYASTWEHICSFAEEYQTQVFASTHSLEFLRAALPLVRADLKNVALIRVYREGSGSNARVVTGKEALTLIESGLELRL